MSKGLVALVLNAHLPFVRQPDFPSFLEERWLFESLSESYLPLLRVFARLEADKIPWQLNLVLSPTLATMLSDRLLCTRYIAWLETQLNLADKEIKRCASDPVMLPLAKMYRDLYKENYEDFTVLHGSNILNAINFYYKKGRIDLMTSAATNAFLPFYQEYPEAIAAQVEAAVVSFRSMFGRSPSGFWLPQLGWYSGLEDVLSAYGLQYSIISARSAMLGTPTPKYGTYAPISCQNGFTTFIRDIATAESVWSATRGYPADAIYRDFYRDIGYDLPLDYIAPYIEQNQTRIFTGFKYWAVTGNETNKKPYSPLQASMKAKEHAASFIKDRIIQAEATSKYMPDQQPIMAALYNADLFGHWWFEGPQWIESIFRIAKDQKDISFTTLAECRKQIPESFSSQPEYASWGDGGYGSVWLEKSNDWIYRHVFKMIERMTELAERFPNESGLLERILNQLAREVLLAQASDWPFLLRAGKAGVFARKQIEDAVSNFTRIYEKLCSNSIGTEWLTRLEKRNNIFPNINYRVFRRKR